MTLLKPIPVGLVLIVTAFAVGRYSVPVKIEEKQKLVYKDRVIEKKVYVKDESEKTTDVKVKLVTLHPDGTKEIETKTYKTADIEITQKQDIAKTEDKDIQDTKEKKIEKSSGSILISAAAKDFQGAINYGIIINKSIIGPLYLGAFAFTDHSFGLTGGISF